MPLPHKPGSTKSISTRCSTLPRKPAGKRP